MDTDVLDAQIKIIILKDNGKMMNHIYLELMLLIMEQNFLDPEEIEAYNDFMDTNLENSESRIEV